ncbi:hypothetical protein FVE67_05115 [Thermosulfurimonas marina]|uniref:Cytochrome c-552/4 domain-containing protein n=1 Tax=Thermosulfurimonas marina TaxID=2047767 RepID=A0A6H1WSR4_9BACT|nr:multiheme c-type cytochrome [Thermosulfurimonas marina]QJA06218.1 hypothetical protein FVE67_05115 [Thermosulfurimonas marina]
MSKFLGIFFLSLFLPFTLWGYVGSRACQRCHPRVYDGWRSTLHPYMLRKASPQKIHSFWKGTLRFGKKAFTLIQKGQRLWLEISDNTDNKGTRRFSVDYVMGGIWKELYLTTFPNGEIHILPLSWLVEDGQWERNNYWPKTIYQYKCMGCHVTGFRVKKEGQQLVTSYEELGVGCEACHGPGEAHIAAPPEKKTETIINPARIPNARLASMVCGACHSRGETVDGRFRFPYGFRPGTSFEFYYQFKPVLYPDGSSKVHYQQYYDWLRSGHARGGVMCWDCHEVHARGRANRFQTKLPANLLCRNCHVVKNKGVHGIHSVNNCVGCHMPLVGRRGLRRDVHSHHFRVILPDWTLRIGSFEKQPNSCNACHYHRKDSPEEMKKALDFAREGLNF